MNQMCFVVYLQGIDRGNRLSLFLIISANFVGTKSLLLLRFWLTVVATSSMLLDFLIVWYSDIFLKSFMNKILKFS